jgi:hypothetical protein
MLLLVLKWLPIALHNIMYPFLIVKFTNSLQIQILICSLFFGIIFLVFQQCEGGLWAQNCRVMIENVTVVSCQTFGIFLNETHESSHIVKCTITDSPQAMVSPLHSTVIIILSFCLSFNFISLFWLVFLFFCFKQKIYFLNWKLIDFCVLYCLRVGNLLFEL